MVTINCGIREENGFGKGKRKRMNITDQIYMGAEAAMSNALAGVSRQNGVKRLFIVLCASTTARCFVLPTTLRILKTDELMKYRPRRSVEPRGACCGSVDYTRGQRITRTANCRH